MEIQKHILSILQLYEFSMALGTSLDFLEVCDEFLKLVLKRKGLNAAWVLDLKEDQGEFKYSIPQTKLKNVNFDQNIKGYLQQNLNKGIVEINDVITQITPILIEEGTLIYYPLLEDRYLFFYAKEGLFSPLEYHQLKPVIKNFSVSLEACEAYQLQKGLLSKLEIQNQELSEYAHMVSHDLKSPLRSIDALTAWLKEDHEKDVGEDGVEKIKLIRNNVAKMDALVSGILDYSTVGKSQKQFSEVDLQKLLEGMMSFIEIPNHIEVKIENRLPKIIGDKHRLQQLFQNLIVNAIANNDKEKGWVYIGYNHKKEFYIRDNGKGIAKDYLEKIFKAFYKLENNPNSVGLGLSIVKKIVELYKGKIWVESEPNVGTVFYFTLTSQ